MTIGEVLKTMLLDTTVLERNNMPGFLAGLAMGGSGRDYDKARELLGNAIEFLNARQAKTEN